MKSLMLLPILAAAGVGCQSESNTTVSSTGSTTTAVSSSGGLVSAPSSGSSGATGSTGGVLTSSSGGETSTAGASTGGSSTGFVPQGTVVTVAGNRVFNGPTCADGGFNVSPAFVVIDSTGTIYTLGSDLDLIGDGGEVTTVIPYESSPGMSALAVDPMGGLFVALINGIYVDQIFKVSGSELSLFAGSGLPTCGDTGSDAGSGFDSIQGLAMDALGNLYGTEANYQLTSCSKIRRIDPGGTISTVAGNGDRGFRNGPPAQAEFSYPSGIAVDSEGVIYVADVTNEVIRKIATDGTTTTLAGAVQTAGFADGYGSDALFNGPTGLALDAAGNLYVADLFNYRVRVIDPSGHVTTLAGNGQSGLVDGTLGPDGSAEFSGPNSVAVDSLGNVWVADTASCSLREIKLQAPP